MSSSHLKRHILLCLCFLCSCLMMTMPQYVPCSVSFLSFNNAFLDHSLFSFLRSSFRSNDSFDTNENTNEDNNENMMRYCPSDQTWLVIMNHLVLL